MTRAGLGAGRAHAVATVSHIELYVGLLRVQASELKALNVIARRCTARA